MGHIRPEVSKYALPKYEHEAPAATQTRILARVTLRALEELSKQIVANVRLSGRLQHDRERLLHILWYSVFTHK